MNRKTILESEYAARINRAFDYIEANLEKPLTPEELARLAHFSKFHFNRIFKALTGYTPFQFLLRLEKAATLMLINPKDSITDIAYR